MVDSWAKMLYYSHNIERYLQYSYENKKLYFQH